MNSQPAKVSAFADNSRSATSTKVDAFIGCEFIRFHNHQSSKGESSKKLAAFLPELPNSSEELGNFLPELLKSARELGSSLKELGNSLREIPNSLEELPISLKESCNFARRPQSEPGAQPISLPAFCGTLLSHA